MKCFNHAEKDGVAICKNCHKALCKDCLTEVHNGIACSSTCVDEVKALNKMIDQNSKLINGASKKHKQSGFVLLFIGLGMIALKFLIDAKDPFLFIMGGIMIVSAIPKFIQANKLDKSPPKSDDNLDI